MATGNIGNLELEVRTNSRKSKAASESLDIIISIYNKTGILLSKGDEIEFSTKQQGLVTIRRFTEDSIYMEIRI